MDVQYKVILSGRNLYKEILLLSDHKTVVVGTKVDCDVRLSRNAFFEPFSITFCWDDEKWNVICEGNIYISSNSVHKLLQVDLCNEDHYALRYESTDTEFLSLDFAIDFDSKIKNYDLLIDIKRQNRIVIGGSKNADIYIESEYVQDGKAVLRRYGQKWKIADNGIPSGVFVNGVKIKEEQEIENYDFFSIAYNSFFYKNGKLYTAQDAKLRISGLKTKDAADQTECLVYPKFNRNSRIMTVLNDKPITILDVPEKPQEPKENLFLSLFPAVAMVVLTVMMRNVMGGSSYLLFSVGSMGLGVVTSLMTYFSGKKQYKKDCEHRIEVYNDYIERKKKEIQEERKKELTQLQELYLDQSAEKQLIKAFSSHLFERSFSDMDFAELYLGTGARKSVRVIDYKEQEKVELADDLSELPAKLADDYGTIEKAPITLPLKSNNAVGVVGNAESCYSFLKNTTYDLAVRHYPGDVHFYYVCNQDSVERLKWVRWLPHTKNERLGVYNIACDEESRNLLFEDLFIRLTNTAPLEENETLTDYNVVFVLDDMGLMQHPLSQYIADAKRRGFVFIFFACEEGLLPKHCESMIQLYANGKNGVLKEARDSRNTQEFSCQVVSDAEAEWMAYKMAPVYCDEVSLEGGLAKNYTLYQMLHIFEAEEADLKAKWKSAEVYRTLKAPLGIDAKGEIIYLDLHENAHGPHGLVAGTTGSGKSELLQSYILSMAIHYHPDDVGFVIIDFKGGGMANQFAALPHLIGTITNIDGREIDRSLKSIRAELEKRQRLFAEYNVNKIDSYIMKYKAGEANVALPHLILVVDEFAELKADQPEFMKELISTARIGRSLGVHLILATQKPAGQVDDQIWSNSKFKLCLKVQDQADSNEVLKSPLAAEIREPGRAYLQVGNNEIFTLFQSAYSGGSAETEESAGIHEFELSEVNVWGRRNIVFQQKNISKTKTGGKSQLKAMTEYIRSFCEQNGIHKLPSICMPPLEDVIPYPETESVLEKGCVDIGIYDDPERQIQERTMLDISTKNTFILGSSRYGKTNLLQGIIRSVLQNTTAEEANIYIIDFGSMILRNFEESDHVGGVVCSNEDEKLKNLFKLIDNEIRTRREILAKAGVSSFAAYREAGYSDLPQMYLIIDNLTALIELYLEDDDTLLVFIREGAAVGVTTIAANTQTAGISYKYLSNFANKIVMYCNDSSEYNSVFDHVAMQPKEVPGRCIFELDNRMLECQIYLSFDGEKEIERVTRIRKLIERTNRKPPGKRAKKIPFIPAVLAESAFSADYGVCASEYRIPVGLTYEEVAPYFMNLSQMGAFALCGREGSGHGNFVNYILSCLEMGREQYPAEVCIFDDITYKYKHCQDLEIVTEYTVNPEEITHILGDYYQRLSERYQLLMAGGTLEHQPLLLMIIQNNDVAKVIAENITLLDQYREILSRLHALNVCFLYANYKNAGVAYDAPEPLHMIKQERHLLLFDNVSDLKVFDPDYDVLKRYRKKVGTGDAYYFQGNDVVKLKMVRKDAQSTRQCSE